MADTFFAAHQRRLQVHAKVGLGLGVESPLEVLVLGVVGSAVGDDENRLRDTRSGGGGTQARVRH